MNVALFASAFHPYVGGVEEHVRQVAHELARRGHAPIVLTNRWPRSMPAVEDVEGIPVHRFAFRVPDGSAKAHVTYRLTGRAIREEVASILAAHGTDVLHVHCVSANAWYACAAKRTLGMPLVVTTHGEVTMDATRVFQKSRFMNRVLREAIETADVVTACSAKTLADVEAQLGRTVGAGRGRVVYNGIRPADFADPTPFDHPRPYVLGIGRLVTQKGFDVLLRAYAMLPAGDATPDLLIAGDGPEAAPLRELAASLGIAARVRFTGRADRATAVALFHGCACFALPSREEPMGIVNLEAMFAGKAVVASRVGGVPEVVVEDETGLFVPPENPQALAAALRRLIDDAPLRGRLGAAGRKRAAAFTWEATTDQYLEIYAWLATAARPLQPA